MVLRTTNNANRLLARDATGTALTSVTNNSSPIPEYRWVLTSPVGAPAGTVVPPGSQVAFAPFTVASRYLRSNATGTTLNVSAGAVTDNAIWTLTYGCLPGDVCTRWSGPDTIAPAACRVEYGGMAISDKDLWSLAFDEGSFLAMVGDAPGLQPLMEGVEVATLDTEEARAEAGLDDEDAEQTLIWITTGLHEELRGQLETALESIVVSLPRAWVALGWNADAFDDRVAFLEYLTAMATDFIVAHELGHVARGHVDRYCRNGFALVDLAVAPGADERALGMTTRRRQALELDADSTALYFLITLSEGLRAWVARYQKTPSVEVYVATLSFCVRVVFAMFSAKDGPVDMAKSLVELHEERTYPHPNVRASFADQRIAQLSSNGNEAKAFRKAIALSEKLFVACVSAGAFPSAVLAPELQDFEQTAAFMNLLVEEIEQLEQEGWTHDTRMTRSLEAVQRAVEQEESR